jgi:hypothetical protein
VNILYRTGLLGLAAIACLIALGPVLFVVASAATVIGLFALAVAVVAVVLLGERWIDEGLKGYSFLDALDDAFHEVVKGTLRTVYRAKNMPGRIRSVLPSRRTLGRRARLILAVVALPFLTAVIFVVEGFDAVRRESRGTVGAIRRYWAPVA